MIKKSRIAGIKKIFGKECHVDQVKINNGADAYCMKEDTRLEGPYQFGEKPFKMNSKTDWEEVFLNAKNDDFDKIPANIKVKHYSNL